MPCVKIGVQVQPQHSDYEGMKRAWVEAEEIGCDMIFNWDHFYPLYGDPDGKHYEGLTTLAAMAEVTQSAQIGSLVFCNSYRNPEYLADAHRTIDHISGGRTILGIGAGWFERDYDEFGYEFGTAPDRLRALRENLPRIEERLKTGNPAPVGAMPILIGGSGPKVTLKLVAKHAKYWHSFGDTDAFHEKNTILREHCETVGRDHADIEITWSARTGLDAEAANSLIDAGVHHLIANVGGDGSGYDLGHVRELVQWRDARGDSA